MFRENAFYIERTYSHVHHLVSWKPRVRRQMMQTGTGKGQRETSGRERKENERERQREREREREKVRVRESVCERETSAYDTRRTWPVLSPEPKISD